MLNGWFLAGDLVKAVLTAVIARGVHAAYPGLLGDRVPHGRGRSCLSDRGPVTSAADPVAAFLAAHDAGEPVALATSGTSTGPAVGGAHHGVVGVLVPAVERLTGLDATSRVWVPGPLTATMNLFAAVHATMLGATLVDSPADATHAVADAVGPRGPWCAGGLRPELVVVVAGDRLEPALHDEAVRAGLRVHHYYGSAELSFVAWGSHAGDLAAFPGVEVEVRSGEIWVRTPYLCTGYDGPPGPLRVGDDGFATVGDRGVLRDGILTVAGRPGAVQVGGATVEPAEVEARLRDLWPRAGR